MSTKKKSEGQVLAVGGDPNLSIAPKVNQAYFQRQKITLEASTDQNVDPSKWGDSLKFGIHEPEQGVKLYPGSASVVQLSTAHGGDPGPWDMQGYVDVTGVNPEFVVGTIWTQGSGETLSGKNPGTISGGVNPSYIQTLLPQTKLFTGVSSPSPPTQNGTNQLVINTTYLDKTQATITDTAMTVGVSIGDGTSTDFSVYPWDYTTSAWGTQKAPKDPEENKSPHSPFIVDSAATGPAEVKFAIVPESNNAVWTTATLWYGSESQGIATLLIADITNTNNWDDSLPMLKAREENGGLLTLDGLATLHLVLDQLDGGGESLQDGDFLFVILNGKFMPAPRQYESYVGVVATIPASNENINTLNPPAKNTLQYVAYRPSDVNAAPVISGEYTFYVTGSASSNQPPNPPSGNYPQPSIAEQTGPILTADMIAGGMHVKVKFNPPKWKPGVNDVIVAHFYTNGWDENGDPKTDQPKFQYNVESGDISQGFCMIPCDPEAFANYGRDYKNTGDYPSLTLQYEVTPSGGHSTYYSDVLTTEFLTIELGH